MTFITHGFQVSVVSDVQERVRDFKITFALYVKKIFISWVCKVCYTERVYKALNFILFVNMCSHVCQKILSTHFIPQWVRWRSHNKKTKWQKEKHTNKKQLRKTVLIHLQLHMLFMLTKFRSWRGVIDTTLCDKVCQWLVTGQWSSPVLRFPHPIKLTATI